MKQVGTWVLLIVFSFVALAEESAADKLRRELNEAGILVFEKKFDKAKAKYDAILASNENNVEARIGLMEALDGLKKSDEIQALAKASEAVYKKDDKSDEENKTKEVNGLIVSAKARYYKRDFSGAEADLLKAIKMDDKSCMAYYQLGHLKRILRKKDDAIKYLLKALEADKDYPETYYLLGDLYLSNKDTKNGIKYWNEYLKRVPSTSEKYREVNHTLQQLGGN